MRPSLAFMCILFCLLSGDSALAKSLLFSTHPFANPTVIHQRFEPLVLYLEQATGVRIDIRIAPSYLAHVQAIGTGEADLGFAGPSPYVRAHDKYGGIELLARYRLKDDLNDKVVIVCRKDSSLQKITDLKGQSFAFGDHQSFGSHFMPRWILHQNGLSLDDFTSYEFVKSHDNVILSVLHGDFSAGGARMDVFKKYENRPLRILAGPFPIAPHVLVCRRSLDPDLKKTLRQSLIHLTDRKILDHINKNLLGFEQVTDSDFNGARAIMKFTESR